MMNKRVLRKFAIPSSSPNPKNGIFCADQVKYVVRTAIKNIDHQRTLVLYIYAKESVLAGNHTPRWTMFQQKGGYITLCTDDKGTRWQQSMFVNLGKDYFFRDKCSFYSQADENRVTRYCHSEKQKGFDSLCLFQLDLLRKKQRENELKKQRKIIERMKPVGALPRDIKGFTHRETLPHYIFYDYAKGKAPKNAYCTACKHNISVAEAKHNGEGVCPHCKRKITFKSRGRRGYIVDRSTAQVIQRLGSNEMIIRFVKAYRRYPKSDTPEFHVYENARVLLKWDGSKIVASESYYYDYSGDRITPWHPGDRPVYSQWYYNFEADCCGYLYHRNLDSELLRGTKGGKFVSLIESFTGIYDQMPVSELLAAVLNESGYEAMLRTEGSQMRLDNLAELKQSVYTYETTCGEECTLEHYLAHVALFTNADLDDPRDQVRLMTVHSAKGLEFPHVFLCAMNEGIFPSKKTRTLPGMEEERRLCFVAMTRAQKALYLSEAEGRNLDGSPRYPSRFLLDIDDSLLTFTHTPREDLIRQAREYIGFSTRLLDESGLSQGFAPGTRVRHAVFGLGTVLERDPAQNAQLVQIAAVGNTIPVAMDAAFKFNQLGMRCITSEISEKNSAFALTLTPQDVLLLISNSGKSRRLNQMAQTARDNGVPVVLITCDRSSPLAQLADHLLISTNREQLITTTDFALSRISAVVIIEVLYNFLLVGRPGAKGFVSRHEVLMAHDKDVR